MNTNESNRPVDVLPGERRPFRLEQPFTVEEVVGLADKLQGRRRAALLAYAQMLQREPAVSELIAAGEKFSAMYQRDNGAGTCWEPEIPVPEYDSFCAALAAIGSQP